MGPFDNKAKEMVYGEIGDFAEGMMLGESAESTESPDYLKNRAKPENIPGDEPAEPGVTFSDEEMGMLEQNYGAMSETNY